MSAPRPLRSSPDPATAPLTIAGAADLVARELRHFDRTGAYQSLDGAAYAAIRRAQRVLSACVSALNDPIAHRPCCAEAARAHRPGRAG